jgi:organic radical activating enzyme
MPKTYCDLPFEHQYVHMSGTVRLCCATLENAHENGKHFNMAKDKLSDVWNSEYMKKVRLNMKNGKMLDACSKCVAQEARGYGSMRTEHNKEVNLKKVAEDGSMVLPSSMELHFGNICNLKCKMCGQDYSNQVGKEILDIGKKDSDFLEWVREQSGNVNNWTNDLSVEYTWFKSLEVKNRLMEYISSHIYNLTIIGGEPTVIPEFYELLDYCDKQNTLDGKNIVIVTNLTNTNPKMLKWLSKMKQWTIWASIDGIGEITEYIRYPSNYKRILQNIEQYKELLMRYKNGRIVFSPAVQLLNIHQLDDMLKLFLKIADGNWGEQFDVSWLSQVWYPKICNYDTAPKEYRLQVANKLSQSKDFFKPYPSITTHYNKQIQNLEGDFLDKTMEKHLQHAFMRYNDTQDKHRNSKTWRQLLPNLEAAILKNLA